MEERDEGGKEKGRDEGKERITGQAAQIRRPSGDQPG